MGFNLKSLFPYLAGAAGSGVASQFSALQPFSAAIGAGAGALTNKKNPLAGAAQGFAGGGVGSSLAGGLKNLVTPGEGGALSKFGSGAMSGIKSFGGSIPGFGGVGTDNPTGALAKFFSGGGSGGSAAPAGFSIGNQSPLPASNTAPYKMPNFSAASTLPSIGGTSLVNSPAGSASGSATGAMNPMSMFKNIIPGLAVAGAGSLLAPKVEAPDYSGVKNDLMNRIQSGGSPEARSAAMQQYLSTVQAPEGASAEAGVANARLINDRQKEDAVRQIQQQFSANNGNTTGNSAYNDAVTKSNAAYDQNYAAQAAQLQFEYDNQQKAQKLAAANALQGMDDTQLQYYAGLAGLDVMQIQEKTGMDVASAQAIKSIAQTAGELMMQKSLGLGGAK